MARNDIENASLTAGEANTNDDPAFTYLVRVAMGHTFEAVRALQHWREVPEVNAFLRELPPEGREALKKATGMVQRIGGAAEHARDRTFHYPYPSARYSPSTDDELAEVLRASGSEEANITIRGGNPPRFRMEFSDRVALALALAKHETDLTKLRQLDEVRDRGGAFARFADHLLVLYADERSLSFG